MRWLLLIICLFATLPFAQAQRKKPNTEASKDPRLKLRISGGYDVRPSGKSRFNILGTGLNEVLAVQVSFPTNHLTWKANVSDNQIEVELEPKAKLQPGIYSLLMLTNAGLSNTVPIFVQEQSALKEPSKPTTKDSPFFLPTPGVVTGAITQEGSDWYKIELEPGQLVELEVFSRRIGSELDPVLQLYTAEGKELPYYADDTPGLQGDCRLQLQPERRMELICEVRDSTYRSGAEYSYRLRIGTVPQPSLAFPLAIERGQTAEIQYYHNDVSVWASEKLRAEATAGSVVAYALPRTTSGLIGDRIPILLSNCPELVEVEPNDDTKTAQLIPVPGGISARFATKSDRDCFRWEAKAGSKYRVKCYTTSFNLPTEVLLKVLDANMKPLATSDPMQPEATVELEAKADGTLYAVCEHLNLLAGPTEAYRLEVTKLEPDFKLNLATTRVVVPAGGTAFIPFTGITFEQGFNQEIVLTWHPYGLANASEYTLPKQAVGPFVFPVSIGTAQDQQAQIVSGVVTGQPKNEAGRAEERSNPLRRLALARDFVSKELAGLPNPPRELQASIALGIVPAPVVSAELSLRKSTATPGEKLIGNLALRRPDSFRGNVEVVLVSSPKDVKLTVKPLPEATSETQLEISLPENLAQGTFQLALATKYTVGGQTVLNGMEPVWITTQAKKEVDTKKP